MLGVNRHHELIYQMGLQLLFSGKPLQAFESLLGAVQVFRTNPRVWYRIAEACIGSWKMKEKELVRMEPVKTRQPRDRLKWPLYTCYVLYRPNKNVTRAVQYK